MDVTTYPDRCADNGAQAVSLHAGLAACAPGAYLRQRLFFRELIVQNLLPVYNILQRSAFCPEVWLFGEESAK